MGKTDFSKASAESALTYEVSELISEIQISLPSLFSVVLVLMNGCFFVALLYSRHCSKDVQILTH